MPYLIPEPAKNPLIDEIPIRGFCVYLPDDIGFLSAFIGAYQFFTKWVAYERDDTHSASRAAHMFQVAYDKTLETFWSEGCGDSMAEPCVVNVVNNNYITCGCGSTSPTTFYCVNEDGTIVINPPPITDAPPQPVIDLPPDTVLPPPFNPDIDPPPDGFDDWGAYDTDACEAANAMVAWLIQVLRSLREYFAEDVYIISAGAVVIFNLFISGWAVIFSSAAIVKLANLWWDINNLTEDIVVFLDDCISWCETNRQLLVCALYEQRYNSAEWENTLTSLVYGATASSLSNVESQPIWRDILFYFIPGNMGWSLMFGTLSYRGATDEYLSCATCANPPYILRTLTASEFTAVANNASASISFNEPTGEFTHTALNESLNYHQVTVSVLVDSVIARIGAIAPHGFLFRFTAVSENADLGDAAVRLPTGTGSTAPFDAIADTYLVMYQGDLYANSAEYAQFIDTYPTKHNYGNGIQSDSWKNQFTTETYSTNITHTFTVKAWVILSTA